MTKHKVKKLLRAYAQKSLEQYRNNEIRAKLLAYLAALKVENKKNRG